MTAVETPWRTREEAAAYLSATTHELDGLVAAGGLPRFGARLRGGLYHVTHLAAVARGEAPAPLTILPSPSVASPDSSPKAKPKVAWTPPPSDRADGGHPIDRGKEWYLYVIEIAGVCVKVGVTSFPSRRLRNYAQSSRAYGRELGRAWIFPPHIEALDNEGTLVSGHRNEWLALPYEDVLSAARKLRMTRAFGPVAAGAGIAYVSSAFKAGEP